MVDELHLLLRVTDRLEDGLFHTIIDQDQKNGDNKGQTALISAMKGCGITLKFWKDKKDKNYEWTSLMGNDKKKMLRKLPSHFHEFLPPAQVEPTKELWNDFEHLYNTMNRPSLSAEEIDVSENKVMIIYNRRLIKFIIDV
ncbi:uncharacterized protein [Clytia hemisphaerica]|uniref:uncharacterized protein n=1 Tax=Clytia hemisphaerica TaxID=252671 RepID=UPI0034D5F6A8